MEQVKAAVQNAAAPTQDWLLSPAAGTQFGLLIVAYGLSVLGNRLAAPHLRAGLMPPVGSISLPARVRRFGPNFTPFPFPPTTYVLTAMGVTLTRSLFRAADVIAFGKRMFIFVAARLLVRQIITYPLPHRLIQIKGRLSS